eukprot:Colp12_sorted_trinity150504_noHs@27100
MYARNIVRAAQKCPKHLGRRNAQRLAAENSPSEIETLVQERGHVAQKALPSVPAGIDPKRFKGMTGAQIFHEMMLEHDVKHVFGYPGGAIKPQAVIEELYRQTAHMSDKVTITTGVGQHQMWAAQYYRWRHPRSWISSGGLGTMGYGVPAAIGAKVARPDHIVVDIDGDASFCMTAMEMVTAAQYKIGVKILILNNHFQGMVKQWQDLFYEERYSQTKMINPDFKQLAEAMNCKGLRVDKAADLPKVMEEFLSTDEPVILDAIVEKDEHVYPMVAAGRALHDMVLAPKH